MSTHRLIFRRRRVFRLPAFSILGGLLLALQLWLPASAFAIARQSPPLTQDVARAGVSVVRLLVYYAVGKTTDANPAKPTAACTGLGVLLSSQFKPDTKQYQNWVLTDGSLVNSEDQATCLDTSPAARLSRIEVYTSSAYNSQPLSPSIVATPEVTCLTRPAKCSQGPALFSFLSDLPQPFIDFPSASVTTTATASAAATGTGKAFQLTSNDNTVGTLNSSEQDAKHLDDYEKRQQAFLFPNIIPSASNRELEAGAPFVDSNGSLAGLYLSSAPPQTTDDIQSFVTKERSDILGASNPVHDNWKSGMDAYYTTHSSSDAHTDFSKAFQANPQFEAAQRFMQLSAQTVTVQARKASTSAPADQSPSLLNSSLRVAGFTIPYWQIAAAVGFLFLLLIIFLVILLSSLARRRRRKRMLAADLADAERHATVEAQRIAEMEAMQKSKDAHYSNGTQHAASAQPEPSVPLQYSPVSQPPVHDQEPFPASPAGLRCPRCGEEIAPEANFCTNCRLQLSPSESGLHLRIVPPVASEPSMAPLQAPPPTKPLIDHPTVVPALPVAEQPTLDMATMNHDANRGDLEKTVPYAVRHLNGQHLGFVVGTRSDPGIKRKYKPNEDSLFAAQGVLSPSSLPQLFGLFVVADGMGGHANGEDASRLAIQTIADYMLPRLTKVSAMSDEQYTKLLIEGIQQANLAVHQNNMQQHGDMGTTVTATLLVDTVAYVANVGDSRTYLYRPSEGLKKVTVDHSVVASLVEAGIIKPDDIYTHPKRNQIYRSLGEKAVVEVDSFTVQLQAGDKLLLCSDGLWDMVRDPKIEAVIKNADPNPSVTGDALIQSALEGGGEDNVSVIVVHVTEGMKTAMPRFQLLTKPDSVQMPQL